MTQVSIRQEDVERKRKYYQITIFSEILYQLRREQVKTIVTEHCNSILFHKCGHANLSINKYLGYVLFLFSFRSRLVLTLKDFSDSNKQYKILIINVAQIISRMRSMDFFYGRDIPEYKSSRRDLKLSPDSEIFRLVKELGEKKTFKQHFLVLFTSW